MKEHNRYYHDIITNNEILQHSPNDGYIDDQLQNIQADNDELDEESEEGQDEDNDVTRTFVPPNKYSGKRCY